MKLSKKYAFARKNKQIIAKTRLKMKKKPQYCNFTLFTTDTFVQ